MDYGFLRLAFLFSRRRLSAFVFMNQSIISLISIQVSSNCMIVNAMNVPITRKDAR